MSLKEYPHYKDCSVPGLPAVPSHWSNKRIKYLLENASDSMKIGPFGSQLTSDMFTAEGYKVYGQENVIAQDFRRGSRFISPEKYAELCVYSVRPGDILITMMGTAGKCAIVPSEAEPGVMDSHLLRVRPSSAITPRLLQRLIDEAPYVAHQIAMLGKGSIMHGLNSGIVKQLELVVPPIAEQSAIATFLDRETGKIDALIAEQEKLLTLLAEKRQATISHAVTKGLNPDAPMKDSGVEWLGEVPAHWEVGCLKRFAEVIDCKHHTVDFLDEGLPIVSIRELRENRIDLSNAKLTSGAEWDFLREGRIPEQGDLVFCRNASVGAVGYVDAAQEAFCMGQDVCLIRPQIQSPFMHFQMMGSNVVNQIEALLVGATIRRANVEEIRNLLVIWPPAAEQSAIAQFLKAETATLDTLAAEATRAIDLLKERRIALISAAVTGKIDVRHLADQEAA